LNCGDSCCAAAKEPISNNTEQNVIVIFISFLSEGDQSGTTLFYLAFLVRSEAAGVYGYPQPCVCACRHQPLYTQAARTGGKNKPPVHRRAQDGNVREARPR
jgi:hypothetical protein